MDFALLIDYCGEIRESEKIDSYLDLVRDIEKTEEHEANSDTDYSWCTWNGQQKFGKGTRELEIRERMETIQTTVLLRLARILKRVQKPKETCGHLDSSEQLLADPGVKLSESDEDNDDYDPIYQPIRSGRTWHKVDF